MSETSDKSLLITFDSNEVPQFKFSGDWNIRNLGRTRSLLFRSYKHYIRELRAQIERSKDERASE